MRAAPMQHHSPTELAIFSEPQGGREWARLKTRLVSPDDVMFSVVLLSDLPPFRGYFLQRATLFLRLSSLGQKVALLRILPVVVRGFHIEPTTRSGGCSNCM